MRSKPYWKRWKKSLAQSCADGGREKIDMRYCLAIDIGASSGRHIVGWQEDGELRTQEVYRFPNGAKESDGRLIWDMESMFESVAQGIAAAFRQFPAIESLSVDTWAVDYVLLNGEKELWPCRAYRDSRTEARVPEVHGIIPFSQLYRRTGCQFQSFNTIYQLYDDLRSGRLAEATDFLMIPEYLLWKLSGVKMKEFTNATTTGMVNAATGSFDPEIYEPLGLPRHLFPTLTAPGTVMGPLRPEIAARVGGQCQAVLCATHDTASAVEGIPMEGSQLYISSGTWSLLGGKTPRPLTDAGSEAANYSNEGGVGCNRYQKNIMGLWLVQRLQKELCPDKDFGTIAQEAAESSFQGSVDANAQDFLAPASMKEAIESYLRQRGQALPACERDYFCCAFRSLALGYRQAIEELERNVGRSYERLYIVGGGARNRFLNTLTAQATGKDIIALPIEATALGNLRVQMAALS